MVPFGKAKLPVLVVGEAPGETEDNEGRPFIGLAGEKLRELLDEIGIDLDDATTTNALICRPPDNKIKNERSIDFCRPNLVNTIEKVKPRVIVTLGQTALKSVLGNQHWLGDVGPMERWAGWKIPTKDYWICPTYHPSYLIRLKSELLERQVQRHLKMAFGIQNDPPKLDEPRIEKMYDDKEVWKILNTFKGWVAIDYETNCLKPEYAKARIVSCAVSDGDTTVAFPWIGKAIEATRMLLEASDCPKIASNLKFEDRFSRHFLGCKVRNWGWDTMLAAHCLDNRPGITGLKFQAFVHLGVPTYNNHIEPYLQNHNGIYNRIEEIALDDLLHYNGMDAVQEFRLAQFQRRQLGYKDKMVNPSDWTKV
jgi:DNA polymerase